jgi:hypothetical protein
VILYCAIYSLKVIGEMKNDVLLYPIHSSGLNVGRIVPAGASKCLHTFSSFAKYCNWKLLLLLLLGETVH